MTFEAFFMLWNGYFDVGGQFGESFGRIGRDFAKIIFGGGLRGERTRWVNVGKASGGFILIGGAILNEEIVV